MINDVELLLRAARILNAGGIRYLIGGSVAAMQYGEPRMTRDIDIVVFLRFGDVGTLIEAFPMPEFYLDRQSILEAMERESQFNVIQPGTGMKIDFMCVELEGHNRSQFERSRRITIEGTTIAFAAPEDVILKKLQYYKEGASDKHPRDIASMIRISGETFDREYVEKWAATLEVTVEWNAVKAKVGW